MPDFNARTDSVNIEQIMEQIRARIREKRGVDYEEQQVQELAKATLEKILDPGNVQADLLDHLKKLQPSYEAPQLPAYEFEDSTLYESTRGPLRAIRRLLNPILKLFFNPNPLIGALHTQSTLNAMYAEREAKRDAMRQAAERLQYELLNNLLLEITRTRIEVKNLKMRLESIGSRLEFNERRTRGLESNVAYRPPADAGTDLPMRSASPAAPPPQPISQAATTTSAAAASGSGVFAPGGRGQSIDGSGQRSRRRRRRRGRRGGAGNAGGPATGASTGSVALPTAPVASSGDAGPAPPVARDDLATFGGSAVHPTEPETRSPEPAEPAQSRSASDAAPDIDDPQ